MISCRRASPADIPFLKRLWGKSFDDTNEAIDLFFTDFFAPGDCVTADVDGKPAAALYILPAALRGEREDYPCHYIYAAATLPEFRGRGVMTELLQFAWEVGRARGDCFSVLVPANGGLFDYYALHGYREHTCVELVTLTRAECLDWLHSRDGEEDTKPSVPDFARIAHIRGEFLRGRPGSLLWDAAAIVRAQALQGVYGGQVLCADGGYALVRPLPEGGLEVQECVALEKSFDKLIGQMVKLDFNTIAFRFAPGASPFKTPGHKIHFSMIKPLGAAPVLCSPQGYVGLPLD